MAIMYGAILGDIIGSPFEFDRGEKTKEFDLFTKECNFTDDSVMTIVIAEALLAVGSAASLSENYKPIKSMKEVLDQLRKLRRQFLRYQQVEIVYSLSHKKLLELASEPVQSITLTARFLLTRTSLMNIWSGSMRPQQRHTKAVMLMSGNVWIFSDQIDDVDMEFMAHEFVTYNIACDYYGLGLKPVTRMSHECG